MSDIVERLHSKSPYLTGSSAERAMEDAAAEIERLTAELETQKAISNQIQGHLEHEELRSYKAEADNERLRAAILVEIAKGTYALAQEIIRLGAALRGVEESTDLDEAQGIARHALD